MKKLMIILFFTIALVNNVFCQIGLLKTIPVDFCQTIKPPIKYMMGDTIIINCDTVFVFNRAGYSYYNSLKAVVLGTSPCSAIISSYEKSLIEQQKAYSDLLNNCNLQEKITNELITSAKSSLEATQKTLGNTQDILKNSIESLDIAKKLAKKEKTMSILEKILIGLGGAGVGAIVTVFATK